MKAANTSFDESGKPISFTFLFEKDAFGNEHAERSVVSVSINDGLIGAQASL
jgi:hypothetical protein